jgi:hypothetical protein
MEVSKVHRKRELVWICIILLDVHNVLKKSPLPLIRFISDAFDGEESIKSMQK